MTQIRPIYFEEHAGIRLIPVSNDEKYLLDMHSYSVLEDFYRYLEFDAFKSVEETRVYLDGLIKRSEADNCQYWFIQLCTEDVVVGTIGIHSADGYRLSAEIGYGLSPKYQGRGIFSRSLSLILEHMFCDLKYNRVVARTDASNEGSIKALMRHGFICEGIMRSYYRYSDGAYSDCSLFSKLLCDHNRVNVR